MDVALLDIPFTGGANEWDDARLVQPGSFLKAENLWQNHAGALRKRWGYGSLSTTVLPVTAPSTLPNVRKLASTGDQLVCAGDHASEAHPFLYSYLETGLWNRVGAMSAASMTRRPVTKPSEDVMYYSFPHTAYEPINGFVVDCWTIPEGTDIGVWIRITEASTRATVANPTKISATVGPCIMFTLNGYVVVVMYSTAGVQFIRYSINTGAVTTTTVANAGGPYIVDAAPINGTNFGVSYVDRTTSAVTIVTNSYVAATGALTATVSDGPTAGNVVRVACNWNPNSGVGAVAWVTDGSTGPGLVRCRGRSTVNLTSLYATVTVQSPCTGCWGLAVGIGFNDKALVLVDGAIVGSQNSCFHNSVSTAGALEMGAVAQCFHARIVSRPFLYQNRLYAVLWSRGDVGSHSGAYVAPGSDLSATVLVCLDADPTAGGGIASNHAYYLEGAVARGESPFVLPFTDPAISAVQMPATIVTPTADGKKFTCAIPVVTLALTQKSGGLTTISTLNGSDELTIDFDERRNGMWSTVRAQDSLFFGGSTQRLYDGTSLVEVGFVDAPSVVDVATVGGASPLTGGTYRYRLVWEWFDAKGNLQRSQPSPIVGPVVAAAGAANTLEFRTLQMTLKNKSGTGPRMWNPRAMVYRTNSTGTGPYYLVSPPGGALLATAVAGPTENNPSFWSLFFTDRLADNPGFGTLYTEGGVQENACAPAVTHLVAHKGRFFGISADDPRVIYYTKPIEDNVSPEWSASFSFRLDESPDPAQALASLDDKLVVFCGSKVTGAGRIYYIVGNGPNKVGKADSFSDPFLLTSDVGCAEPRSVVSYDEGVLFFCRAGIYQVGRDLTVSFIGKPVQDTTSTYWDTCGDASIDPFRAIVIWQFSDSKAVNGSGYVAFCYSFGSWFKWTGTRIGSRHCFHNGLHHTDGIGPVAREGFGANPGMDVSGTWITSTLRTPWVRLQAVNGYQHVQEVQFLGAKASDCTLTSRVYVDFDGVNPAQSSNWVVGPASPLLGLPVVRIALSVKPQECGSIQLEITDALPSGTVAENPAGIDFAGLTFLLGTKKGTARIPAVNRA